MGLGQQCWTRLHSERLPLLAPLVLSFGLQLWIPGGIFDSHPHHCYWWHSQTRMNLLQAQTFAAIDRTLCALVDPFGGACGGGPGLVGQCFPLSLGEGLIWRYGGAFPWGAFLILGGFLRRALLPFDGHAFLIIGIRIISASASIRVSIIFVGRFWCRSRLLLSTKFHTIIVIIVIVIVTAI